MGGRNTTRHICVCLLIILFVTSLQGGSSEVIGDVANNGHVSQSGRGVAEKKETEKLNKSNQLNIRCPIPEPPKNGFIIGEVIRVGAVLRIRCHDGYSLNGPTEMSCVQKGNVAQWHPAIPRSCTESDNKPKPSLETSQGTESSKSKKVISPPFINVHSKVPATLKRRHHEERKFRKEPQTKPIMPSHSLGNQFPARCLHQPDAGPCNAIISRYYFKESTMECYKFVYGGCDGNSNNFETLSDCDKACLGQ